MKKLIFLFAFCIVVTNVFAQTAPEQLKKEGNDAFNAKNYPVAYAKFSEYLKQTNNQDSATAYYCGIAADEVKKYAEAVTFFDIAIQKKFNIGNAYARKALALDAQKKTAEYVATLEEGLKVDPKNKTMVKNYGLHYLKAGLAAQKAGKADCRTAYRSIALVSDADSKTGQAQKQRHRRQSQADKAIPCHRLFNV